MQSTKKKSNDQNGKKNYYESLQWNVREWTMAWWIVFSHVF
jgi:hypothetical protein